MRIPQVAEWKKYRYGSWTAYLHVQQLAFLMQFVVEDIKCGKG